MKRGKKGTFGYIRRQKLTRFGKTMLFFLLPLILFVIGLVLNGGDRKNIYTVIAMVGCIPACMSTVSMLMMWMRKPMDPALYQEISAHAGELTMAYELYLTTYEKNVFLDAAAFCGEELAAYTHEKLSHEDLVLMEEHIRKTMRASQYRVNVKIFDQKKKFLERLDTLREKKDDLEQAANAHFVPYEKYPDLSRNEVIKHLLMAVSL